MRRSQDKSEMHFPQASSYQGKGEAEDSQELHFLLKERGQPEDQHPVEIPCLDLKITAILFSWARLLNASAFVFLSVQTCCLHLRFPE